MSDLLNFIDSDSDSDSDSDCDRSDTDCSGGWRAIAGRNASAFTEVSTQALQAIIQHRKRLSGQVIVLYLQRYHSHDHAAVSQATNNE